MAIFAIVKDEVVVNVIVADTQEIADLVTEIGTAINLGDNDDRVGIGFTYTNGTFQAPTDLPA
jgi:hypothetical protein